MRKTADLVTFTEKILNEKHNFLCSVDTIKPRFWCKLWQNYQDQWTWPVSCVVGMISLKPTPWKTHVNFSLCHRFPSMTFRAKWVDLDVMIDPTVDDNVFIKLLSARRVSIMYVTDNDINKFLIITKKEQ